MFDVDPYRRRAGAQDRTPFPERSADSAAYRHTFTYGGGGSTIRSDLLELIDGAEQKVFIAAWLFGDEELFDALCRAADRLRGGVYFMAAMSQRDLAKTLREPGDDTDDIGERMIRGKRFEDLTARGIAVRTFDGCHAKFAVVDDRVALISSANFDPNALDRNGENGVVVTDPIQVERTARLFTRLWRGCQQEMPLNGEPVLSAVNEVAAPIRLSAPEPGSNGLIWTWNKERHILQTIRELIESAQSELVLATWCLNGMRRRPDLLLNRLRDAIDRGVEVHMLLRNRDRPDHLADAAALLEMGVRLYPCSLNHAKGVIADRERGALFSANFDADHGLDKDVEVGVRIDHTHALEEALRYFEHAIAQHDYEFKVREPAEIRD